MESNKGLTLIALIITIIILLILGGVSINLIIGENGILTRATTVEQTYNKGEVLEELNVMITEKYLDAYGKASAKIAETNQLNLEPYYSGEKVIQFLLGWSGGESGEDYGDTVEKDEPIVIEPLQDTIALSEAGEGESCYFIILSSLNRKITRYGRGINGSTTDYFYIQGSGDSYKVIYRNLKGEPEEIGDLQIQQTL